MYKDKIIGFRLCRNCGGTGYTDAFGALGIVCRCNTMFSPNTKGLEPIYMEAKLSETKEE